MGAVFNRKLIKPIKIRRIKNNLKKIKNNFFM